MFTLFRVTYSPLCTLSWDMRNDNTIKSLIFSVRPSYAWFGPSLAFSSNTLMLTSKKNQQINKHKAALWIHSNHYCSLGNGECEVSSRGWQVRPGACVQNEKWIHSSRFKEVKGTELMKYCTSTITSYFLWLQSLPVIRWACISFHLNKKRARTKLNERTELYILVRLLSQNGNFSACRLQTWQMHLTCRGERAKTAMGAVEKD